MGKKSILTVPQLGVNDDRVKVVSWLVAEGAACSAGQVVCELETTKAVQEVEADAPGILVPVIYVDEEVGVSEPLAIIGDDLEGIRMHRDELRSSRAASLRERQDCVITSKARRVAKELGVDVIALSAAKLGGVVREADVRAAHQGRLSVMVEVPTQLKARDNRLPIAIYGAGSGAVTLKEAADLGQMYEVVCFLDDAADRPAACCSLPVFHGDYLEQLLAAGVRGVATEIAAAATRLRIRDRMDKLGVAMISVIHPLAFVAPSVKVGRGCFVKAGAIIETNSMIGEMCIIDNGVVVAHDNNLADGVHLAPSVSTGGSVQIGSKTIVGIGASIATGTVIGRNCIISVGTAVTRDVPDNSVVEGVPGKIIGTRKE